MSEGRTIGQAFVEIRPKTTTFQAESERQLRGSATALGQHVGGEIEKGSDRGRKALGLLARTFASSSAGALGPLQEIVDKFEVIDRASEVAGKNVSGRLLGIGAAAVGVGTFLQTLSSREQGAQQRLDAAINATGRSAADFREEIDKAVKANERFGSSGDQTLQALNSLTIGLHDPKKALEELGLAQDIAAAKQISLGQAADIVRQAFNGNTRVLKQFGLQIKDLGGPIANLGAAQKTAATAASTLDKAQQSYNDKLTLYRASSRPTLAAQIALKNSHDKVADATAKNARAQEALRKAQQDQTRAGERGEEVLKRIADVTRGQASASADTFTGRLKSLGATIEDDASKFGKDFGPAVTTAGVVLTSLAAIIQLKTVLAFKTLRDTQVLASAEGAAAVETAAASEALALNGLGVVAVNTALKIKAALGGALGASIAGVTAGTIGSVLLTSGDAAQQIKPGDLQKTLFAQEDKLFKSGRFSDAAKQAAKQALAPGFTNGQRTGTGVDKGAAINFLLRFGDNSPAVLSALSALGYTTPSGPVSNLAQQRKNELNAALDGGDPRRIERAKKALAELTQAAPAAGKAAGEQTLAEFLKSIGGGGVASGGGRGIGKGLTKAINAARQPAVDAAKKLAADVAKEFNAANGKLRSDLAASLALQRQTTDRFKQGTSLQDFLSGSAGAFGINRLGDTPGGSGAAGFGGFLTRKKDQLLRFARDLTALRKRGLSPILLAQIADLGAEQGDTVAQALLTDTPGALKELNSAQQAITGAASAVGKAIADSQFGKQIEADRRNTAVLERKLEQIRKELIVAQRQPRTVKVDARKAGASEKQAAHATARAVSLAMKGM